MTSVLQEESSRGKNFEDLIDGAMSLVSGLGSVLRVSSFGAKGYSSMSHEASANWAKLNRKRRRSFEESMLEFVNFSRKRYRRDVGSEKEQVMWRPL